MTTETTQTDQLHQGDVVRTPGDFEAAPGPWHIVEHDPQPYPRSVNLYSLVFMDMDRPLSVTGTQPWERRL